MYQILWDGSLKEREDQVCVSLRSVEGCGSNGQKLRKPAIVYILHLHAESYPRTVTQRNVMVKRVGDCFRGNIYTLSEYFPSSYSILLILTTVTTVITLAASSDKRDVTV